ncbi:hypothetical protein BDV32DRAFT_153929 [Aspergillus pseudonomiae]|uniref:Uncharacterized protein n=1 Tax=Aspergillus pseudonomiae TaxID=1506151 RepID=A0A5N6HMQ8_9EURO|nr:uncharacterized protein BDV37DRAFT_285566 [Aspergillus pseudonomiae]KAB8255791.1 hypothetical protein BDV32DRAFT_153929 [Aspergillus pseudonomiae]KAE8401545.1 hypothetical protein BDV37DRAFT_285566 [Aspergillus pseudonomiae]
MARPCKNCGAPRAEDVPDEIELCEQCTARDAPVASFDSQAGSPTEPNTPIPATHSDGSQGDDIHSGQGREAVDLDEPVLVPDPGSVLVGCGPSQVGMGTSAIAPMPAAPSGSALNDGNRLKRKASALGVEEPILDIEHDQSVESIDPVASTSGQSQGSSSSHEQANNTPANPAKKVKMEPACGSCRKSKIRCTHRKPVVNPRDDAFQQETQRPLQPKESGETSQDDPAHDDPGEESSKRAGLRPKSQPGATRVGRIPPKPRGRPRKQPEEIQAVVDEGNAVEEPESPPRRPRRGRRPAQRMGTSAEGKRGQATAPEPAAAAVPAETMAANLSIASNMALNNILAEDFQDTVRDCGEKWQTVSDSLREAMDSFHEAKHKIDTWLEMWRRGEV